MAKSTVPTVSESTVPTVPTVPTVSESTIEYGFTDLGNGIRVPARILCGYKTEKGIRVPCFGYPKLVTVEGKLIVMYDRMGTAVPTKPAEILANFHGKTSDGLNPFAG